MHGFKLLVLSLCCLALPAFGQTCPTVPFPPTPLVKMAVNPVTNKVYTVNESANTVTVLNAATNTTSTIAVGPRPQFIAVNPLTNRIYVNNSADATLSIIDGATDTNATPTPLAVGSHGPISVNAVTNTLYIVRLTGPGTDEVTYFNGNTNGWYTSATESFQPLAMAVNPITNKIYVVHYGTGDVRVISGVWDNNDFHPQTFSISAWCKPFAIAVNPITNKIYVITEDARGPIGIIDGVTRAATFPLPTAGRARGPKSIAVNPVTNRIYAAFNDEVVVINGSTNAYTYVSIGTTGTGPVELGINTATNKIYVVKDNGAMVVIDGDTNATTTVAIPAGASSVGVYPITNKTYVFGDSMSVVDGSPGDVVRANPLTTTISTFPGNTTGANPSFTLAASSAFSPNALPVNRVYYQLDSNSGAWTAASGTGPYTAAFTGLSSGSHTLYAFATDGQEAPNNTGAQSIPLVGTLASYTFTVSGGTLATPTVSLASSQSPQTVGQPVTFTASVTGTAGTPMGTVEFRNGSTAIPGCEAQPLTSGAATCTTGALAAGSHSITARYSGNSAYTSATSAAITQVMNPPPVNATVNVTSSLNPSVSGQSVTFTASVSGSAGEAQGTVQFRDGAATIAGCASQALAAGSATCATSALAVGTHSITARYSGSSAYNAGTSSALSQVVNSSQPVAKVATDFNADGKSDLLWRNTSTGQVYRMLMNGLAIFNGAFAYTEPDTAWKIVGDGDFNGDGITDVLRRHDTTGQVDIVFFNASGLPAGAPAAVTTEPNAAWKIVHTPDLDGDGKADILWWNSSTGQVSAMRMNGNTIAAQGNFYSEPDTMWKIAAVGDFSGSGRKNQLLWRNGASGLVYLMTVTFAGGAFSQAGAMIYREPNAAWKILAAADSDGDGKSDIVWRNDATGQIHVLLMNGSAIVSQGAVYREPNLAWKVVAHGDYNGDGKADLAWRNDSTGQVYMMLMNGLTISSQAMVYTEPNTAWRILGPWEYSQ